MRPAWPAVSLILCAVAIWPNQAQAAADKLTKPVPLFGVMELPAVAYLNLLNLHSSHHRGQLSTYLRPMGSKVPAIYGGSADEPMQH